MGIRLLRGREIDETDKPNSVHIVVINQAMAERFWPGKDPIGKRFSLEGELDHSLEVVGVVRNSRTANLTSPLGPFFYIPLAQKRVLPVTLQVRTYGNPEAMGPGDHWTYPVPRTGHAACQCTDHDRCAQHTKRAVVLPIGCWVGRCHGNSRSHTLNHRCVWRGVLYGHAKDSRDRDSIGAGGAAGPNSEDGPTAGHVNHCARLRLWAS